MKRYATTPTVRAFTIPQETFQYFQCSKGMHQQCAELLTHNYSVTNSDCLEIVLEEHLNARAAIRKLICLVEVQHAAREDARRDIPYAEVHAVIRRLLDDDQRKRETVFKAGAAFTESSHATV